MESLKILQTQTLDAQNRMAIITHSVPSSAVVASVHQQAEYNQLLYHQQRQRNSILPHPNRVHFPKTSRRLPQVI